MPGYPCRVRRQSRRIAYSFDGSFSQSRSSPCCRSMTSPAGFQIRGRNICSTPISWCSFIDLLPSSQIRHALIPCGGEIQLCRAERAYRTCFPYELTGVHKLLSFCGAWSSTLTSISSWASPSLNSGRGAIQVSRKPRAGIRPSGDFCMQIVPPVMTINTLASGAGRWFIVMMWGMIDSGSCKRYGCEDYSDISMLHRWTDMGLRDSWLTRCIQLWCRNSPDILSAFLPPDSEYTCQIVPADGW